MSNFTLTDISGALSRLLDAPPGHPAVARYAGQLEAFVNSNSDLKRSGLSGSAFQAMAFANMPSEVSDLLNPSKVQDMQRQLAEKANVTSSDFAALSRMGAAGFQQRRMDGAPAGSSADYARNLPGEWSVSKLQSYAKELGVGWAANSADLMRLGPSAIKLLADMHFREEMYKRLSKETGLNAKDIVGIVGYAKRTGQDANQVAGDIADAAKVVGGNDPKARHDAGKIIADHYARPDDPEAARKYDEVRKKVPPGPEHDHIRKKMDDMEEKAKKAKSAEIATDKKIATANSETARTQQKRESNDDLMASLSDTPAVIKKADAKTEKKEDKPPVKVATAQPKAKPASPTA